MSINVSVYHKNEFSTFHPVPFHRLVSFLHIILAARFKAMNLYIVCSAHGYILSLHTMLIQCNCVINRINLCKKIINYDRMIPISCHGPRLASGSSRASDQLCAWAGAHLAVSSILFVTIGDREGLTFTLSTQPSVLHLDCNLP